MSATSETATLVHGYTMAEVDRLADVACAMSARVNRGTMLDREDRKDAAWHAIVELLYSCAEYPDGYTLIKAGSAAVNRETNDAYRHLGITRHHEDAAKFTKYWLPVITPAADFAEHLVERLALPQVLGELTPLEYETLITLAAHGNQVDAAAALGIKPAAFSQRIQSARRRIVRVWLEHETPVGAGPRRSTSAQECSAGHSREQHGYKNSKGWWRCRVCVRNDQRRHRSRL